MRPFFFFFFFPPFPHGTMTDSVYREYRLTKVTKCEAGGYLCMLCGVTIANSGHVKRHFDSKHSFPDAIYVCPDCGKRYNTKNSFQTHLYKSHPDLKGMIELEKCKTPTVIGIEPAKY